MCLTALAIGGAAIGAIAQSNSANNATNAQQDAADQQIALQRSIYRDQTRRFEPFYQSGVNALNAYQGMIGAGPQYQSYGQDTPQYQAYGQAMPEYQAFDYQNSPGYQFQLQQGQRAIDGSAASRGGLFSGATLKAQQEYGTGLAAQDYNNQYQNHLADYSTQLAGYQTGLNANMAEYGQQLAGYQTGFGNYQVEFGNEWDRYANTMNQLSGLAGMGQSAAGMQATAGSNYATGASNAMDAYGNATAAGAVAQGNAVNTGINNALGAAAYYQTQPFTSSWV